MSQVKPGNTLPSSVRYVKNGRKGCWWKTALRENQIHLGWSGIPHDLLLSREYVSIEAIIKNGYGKKRGAKQDFNALHDALELPSQFLWVTFEDGCMWWCTAKDGLTVNPDGESENKGHFWLVCDSNWSNANIANKRLPVSDLPGTVTTTCGFQGTICKPTGWETILRIIRDEQDTDALKASKARHEYELAILAMIEKLSWKDFEALIEHVLLRTGWARTSTLEKNNEATDIEAENPAINETAFVQIKSKATQKILDDYIERFMNRREQFDRMIFAVHSPIRQLMLPKDCASEIQIWTGDKIATLVVRLGLGEWVENRLA